VRHVGVRAATVSEWTHGSGRAVDPNVKLIAALVLVVACKHEPAAPVYCKTLDPAQRATAAVHVLPNPTFCFDDAAACGSGCVAVTAPRWSCMTLTSREPTTDPSLGRFTTCEPTAAMCEGSRPSPDVDRVLTTSACVGVALVYCSESEHALTCAATESECGTLRAELVRALHVDASACTARRSAS